MRARRRCRRGHSARSRAQQGLERQHRSGAGDEDDAHEVGGGAVIDGLELIDDGDGQRVVADEDEEAVLGKEVQRDEEATAEDGETELGQDDGEEDARRALDRGVAATSSAAGSRRRNCAMTGR